MALALYWLQPAGLMPFDDEFGYFRSVLLTVQHGYPRTHDWLEPWAASLSAVVALVFLATGSFTAAVTGLKIFGGASAFVGIFLLLRRRACLPGAAFCLAVALTTIPTMLWKWTELSTLLLYVPCLAGALLASERRQWALFFLLWTIAFTSRQSAIVWLIIPLWHAVVAARNEVRRPEAAGSRALRALRASLPLLPWLFFSTVVAVAMLVLMNQTRSQTILTFNLLQKFEFGRFLDHAIVGLAATVTAIGLGALAMAVSRRQPLSWPLGRRRLAVAAAAAVFTACLVTQLGQLPLGTNGWSHGRIGTLYPYALLLLSLAGWSFTTFALHRPYLAVAASFIVLLGFRILLPEHHLIDIVVFAFFAVLPRPAREADPDRALPSVARPAAIASFAVLLGLHAYFGLVAKNTLDAFYARTSLAEQAMRRGDITPVEILFAPIGYAGWKLYPYFAVHDGRRSEMIGGFMSYLEGSVVAVHGAAAVSGKVIVEDFFPFGFDSKVRFQLIRQNEAIGWTPQLREMQRLADNFPLNDEEWRAMAGHGMKPR